MKLLITCLLFISCSVVEPEIFEDEIIIPESPVVYSDIVGVWGSTARYNPNNEPIEYWIFSSDTQAYAFEEEYIISGNNPLQYRFTNRYKGSINSIGKGYYRDQRDINFAAGKEIINIQWVRVIGQDDSPIDISVLLHISLESLSICGDTLTIRFCVSHNCYRCNISSPEEVYNDILGSLKLVRYSSDHLNNKIDNWKFY